MKKVLLILVATIIGHLTTFAIDPGGSRLDYEDSGIDLPAPLALLGLLIATVGCFWLGSLKNQDGKRDSSGMIWFGVLGIIGMIIIIGSMV